MYTKDSTGRFPLGQIVISPGAIDLLDKVGVLAHGLVERHVKGDWGDLLDFDSAQNEEAVVKGYRIMSKYILSEEDEDVIWIVTEADRSSTTILLPEEY